MCLSVRAGVSSPQSAAGRRSRSYSGRCRHCLETTRDAPADAAALRVEVRHLSVGASLGESGEERALRRKTGIGGDRLQATAPCCGSLGNGEFTGVEETYRVDECKPHRRRTRRAGGVTDWTVHVDTRVPPGIGLGVWIVMAR